MCRCRSPRKKCDPIVVSKDEHPRETSLESLAAEGRGPRRQHRHARRIAGAAFCDHALQLGQRFQAGFLTRVLTWHTMGRLFLGDRHRHDSASNTPSRLSASRSWPASEQVLVFAADLEVVSDVFGRFAWSPRRTGPSSGADEAPADGRRRWRCCARTRCRPAYDEGRAVHAFFHAAGQHRLVSPARTARAVKADGVQARTAQAVDRGAGHFDGADSAAAWPWFHVAALSSPACLRAHDGVVQSSQRTPGVARNQRLDGNGQPGCRFSGARCQRTAVAAEGASGSHCQIKAFTVMGSSKCSGKRIGRS